MIVSKSALSLFHIAKDTVDFQREELAAIRQERDALKTQLAASTANFDWLKTRVNALEIERAQLIEKAYGIKVPAPEIVRQLDPRNTVQLAGALFEDVGDKDAVALGYPAFQ